MLGYVKNVCDYCYAKSVSLMLSLFGIAGFLLGSTTEVFAQTGEAVNVVAPDIDWGNTAQTLISSLTNVVVVGIGIALSIWALMMVVRLFRRSANG